MYCMFYLGEKGEMSCFSLAQLMVGGGTLWTSHGKMASSPSITDILFGSADAPAPPTLDLGRTEHGQTNTEIAIEFLDIYCRDREITTKKERDRDFNKHR